ncbi:heavy metal sensor histidine kinase [Pseudomonas sp. LRF_L74]|uniref:heavy metal sensor histidine kinase n=1 Tax=Pseudomonas sp. LRF_L74 TaxID=3369422 RepID=UPI003F612341
MTRAELTASMSLRLGVLFALVALAVFALIGWALYVQVDNNLSDLPKAELQARYSVLEPALGRDGSPEHWARISNRLHLLANEDRRLQFWALSDDARFQLGQIDDNLRAGIDGQSGIIDLQLPGHCPQKVLISEFPALDQRPPMRFLIAIDTSTFKQARHALLVALGALGALGVVLASVLGYWVARIGLKPLRALSAEAQSLAPPRLSARLSGAAQPAELQQFVSAFNDALARVETAYSRLESFNADVAHELRSPLTNLIGQTQVALTRGRSAEHYFEVLQSNLEELERLRSIINDMLFLASADQGSKATRLVSTALAPEVATTLDYLDLILEEAQVSVQVQGDAEVRIETALWRRALINLLHNAVQHTPAGGVIEVNIERRDGEVILAVCNPGERIAEEHLASLFERFYRVDPSRNSSSAGNHGLGLAIVKAIAQMHGGSVFAESRDGLNRFGLVLKVDKSA